MPEKPRMERGQGQWVCSAGDCDWQSPVLAEEERAMIPQAHTSAGRAWLAHGCRGGAVEPGAIVSGCGMYRYTLRRSWESGRPTAVFVMLNPSTADAYENDPTIRKCIGFAKRWNCGGIRVVNLFAWRATKPKDLPQLSAKMVGPDNGRHQWDALFHCTRAGQLHAGHSERGPCVVAWGSGASHPKRLREAICYQSLMFRVLADRIPVPLQCLGTAQDGNPRHPLMLAYATELQPWPLESTNA